MRVFFVSRGFSGERFDAHEGDPEELVMLVDLDRCIGCGACAFACRIEHEGGLASGDPMRPIVPGMGGAEGRMLCLPTTCRHCPTPCEYHDEYNFWIICPSRKTRDGMRTFCDSCVTRAGEGMWPACATRCTMKTIYFGNAERLALILGEKRLRELGDVEFAG